MQIVEEEKFHQGSTLFEPIAKMIGLPIDQFNFVLCNVIAIYLGVQMRTKLAPDKATTFQRHMAELSIGGTLVFFCFGYQIVHLILDALLCYLLMKFAPRHIFHVLVFVTAMVYICVTHIVRMYYDYNGYHMDITGPLMIFTMKVTSIAFALHDGQCKEEKDLSSDQKNQAIKELPGLLPYYSYVFQFHNIMAGPMVFFADFERFISGENLLSGSKTVDEVDHIPKTPSPNEAILENIKIVVVSLAVLMVSPMIFPVSYMTDEKFFTKHNIIYRNLYMLAAVSLVRGKYYFAWKLGEVASQAAGLGFRGYDERGKEKWDLMNNVDIWKLETSLSLKDNIDSWNKNTLLWLRRVVYDRCPNFMNKTLAVFLCSAVWHGFYPGYYVTFISAALTIIAARTVRRRVRPYFVDSPRKWMYDVATFIATRFANVYLAAPFCLLGLYPSLRLLISVGFYLHIFCFGVMIYFNVINPPKKKQEGSKKE